MADIPMTRVSVSWPVKTNISTDKRVWELDNQAFTNITKNAASQRQETCTLQVKVLDRDFYNFYNFIRNNYGEISQFNYPGLQPFITTSTNNDVKIIDYSNPSKVSNNMWEMSFTILRIP